MSFVFYYFIYLNYKDALNNVTKVRLLNSCPHMAIINGDAKFHIGNYSCENIGDLESNKIIQLLIITDKKENIEKVADYYKQTGLNISDKTDIHFKVKGTVDELSDVFNVKFEKFLFNNKEIYASKSEISVPDYLADHIYYIKF